MSGRRGGSARPRPAFTWTPGHGYAPHALARLEQAFPCPSSPMGEAWFMAPERIMYTDLLGDLRDVTADRLQSALTDIASGASSFGPYTEWRDWFHYLLPRLVPRSHETFVAPLLELLITAFITQYPAGLVDEPYDGFGADVLDTLGRCLMDEACWPRGALDAEICLNKYLAPRRGLWFWFEASGPLSASLFFCLKYLAPDQVRPWLHSVFAIDQARWRGQVMIWLLGAHRVLTGAVKQPSEFTLKDSPRIDWDWSHCLKGDYTGVYDGGGGACCEFISEENRRAALATVASHFTEAVFMDWLGSIASDADLASEIGDAPFQFLELYRSTTTANP